jgi:hypothetical protein
MRLRQEPGYPGRRLRIVAEPENVIPRLWVELAGMHDRSPGLENAADHSFIICSEILFTSGRAAPEFVPLAHRWQTTLSEPTCPVQADRWSAKRSGVTSNEQHFQARSGFTPRIRHLAAVHSTRQPDIGNQHIKLRVRLQDAQATGTVGGRNLWLAQPLQDIGHEQPHGW